MTVYSEPVQNGLLVKLTSGEVILKLSENAQAHRWELVWQGELGGEEIQAALEQILPAFLSTPQPGLFVDERNLMTTEAIMREWHSEHIMPVVYAKGLRKIAILKSKDINTQMMSKLTLQNNDVGFFPVVKYFDHQEDAIAWLDKQ